MAGAGARRWVGTQGDDVTGRPGDPEFEETTWMRVWGLRICKTTSNQQVEGLGLEFWGFALRDWGLGFRVKGLGFRV